MRRWEFLLELDRRSTVPLYRQIAAGIMSDVRRGRLRPGDPLPGTRTLARTLGVQRMTVVAAFDDLVAEGWIVTRPARGTIVSPEIPDTTPPKRNAPTKRLPERTLFDLADAPPDAMPYDVPRGTLLFAPNRPDTRLIPQRSDRTRLPSRHS